MPKLEDLNAKLATLETTIGEIADDTDANLTELTRLREIIAAGGEIPQGTIDIVDRIIARSNVINEKTPPSSGEPSTPVPGEGGGGTEVPVT